MIMRDGWGAHDHWGFLDVGPLGVSGHQHRDKLHLGIFAGGRDLLVDSGRYWYKPEVFRQYVLGTHGHNCLMIDGSGQNDDVETVDAPFDGPAMVTEAFDFCRGSFTAGYLGKTGLAEHTRAVLYLRGKCWIVVDRLRTDRPRTVQALWHFHPDCTVTTDGPDVLTVDPGLGNLRITPVAAMPWRLDLVRGATDPDDAHYRMWKVDIVREPDDPGVQGWYSPQYNEIAPSTCVVYRADGLDSATFAWIIAPAVGDVPAVHVEALALDETHARLRVTLDGETWEVAVPLEGMAPPAL
jgi:hypothetical protein